MKNIKQKLLYSFLTLIYFLGLVQNAYAYEPRSPQLLSPSDITYVGYYDMYTHGLDSPFFQSLTHRYVNGELRLLTYHIINRHIYEISLSAKNFGDVIRDYTNEWNMSNEAMDWNGLWWDEAKQRLWTTSAVDYTTTFYPVQIYTRKLNTNGTTSNLHGPIGLKNINAKRVYGGAQEIPQWFQSQYGVGQYMVGWGGYTSLLEQGGGASLGPTAYSLPDPDNYSNNFEIPVGQYKTIMDSGGASEWYSNGAPNNFTKDRGIRESVPINYFDGGDGRPNGSCPTCNWPIPTNPPLSTAKWLSPAPDGKARWVWGDGNYNTGMWIKTPNKEGFVTIASLGSGRVWYCASNLCYERREYEFHVFDPVNFGKSLQGLIPTWNVRPTYMKQITLPGSEGPNSYRNVTGATFDPVTNRIYMLVGGINTYYTRIYVFQVNDSIDPNAQASSVIPTSPTPPPPTPTPPPPPPPPAPITSSDAPSSNISITSPSSNATLSSVVVVSASVSNNISVAGVQFKLDGLNLNFEDIIAPYSVGFNTIVASNGNHTLSATARDTLGHTYTTSMPIKINNVAANSVSGNLTPVVNAGNDQTINLSSVTLTGTVTEDGLPNNSIDYAWNKVSGPGKVSFSSSASISTTVSFSLPGKYVLRLTASDSSLASSDDIVITVNGYSDASDGESLYVQPTSPSDISNPTTINNSQEILKLLKEINRLRSLINKLLGKPYIPDDFKFNNNLQHGAASAEIQHLQVFLNYDKDTQISNTGWGSPGKESIYFGNATRAALIKFQNKNSILENGYAGLKTREKINSLIGN